jgi:hypothetical protein
MNIEIQLSWSQKGLWVVRSSFNVFDRLKIFQIGHGFFLSMINVFLYNLTITFFV